jgi:hypothetical protein
MLKSSLSAVVLTLLTAAFGQNTASAEAANHRPYQSVGHQKADVPSVLNRFHRWRRPDVYGEASTPPMGAWGQRTLNENSFIAQDRNIEGYPRPRD